MCCIWLYRSSDLTLLDDVLTVHAVDATALYVLKTYSMFLHGFSICPNVIWKDMLSVRRGEEDKAVHFALLGPSL